MIFILLVATLILLYSFDVPFYPAWPLTLAVVLVLGILYRNKRRAQFLEEYDFPMEIAIKLRRKYPHLSDGETERVKHAMKTFFRIAQRHPKKPIAMPSRAVDTFWHEFILYTQEYHTFCKRAFGNYFHHNPYSPNKCQKEVDDSLQESWRRACKDEEIDPYAPNRFPLLFTLDASLGIEDGNRYELKENGKIAGTNGPFASGNLRRSGRFSVSLGGDTGCGAGGDGGGGGGGGGCGGGGCGGG